MKKGIIAVVAILFWICMLIALVSSTQGPFQGMPGIQLINTFLPQTAATVTAVVSLFFILTRSLSNGNPDDLIPLLFPFLAAITLIGHHWSSTVVIATLILGWHLLKFLKNKQRPFNDESASSESL